MGHSASVTLRWTPGAYQATEVIDVLLAYGWSVDTYGAIEYLPLHDDGCFEWQRAAVDQWPTIRAVLAAKHRAQEMVGVSLTWAATQVGGSFLFAPTGDGVAITWTINRRRLAEGCGMTDQSWYVARLLPPLAGGGITLEAVTCYDSWDG